jgi:hypothetical protein
MRDDGINIRYAESFQQSEEMGDILILDFDGFAINIQSEGYLEVLDKLHGKISDEYNLTIKKPVKEYMRRHVENERGNP